ncbi:hypothetical protein V5E97_37575 [Singulisphaera sp. Ch08]|uniref:Major facilitator superfamily (MFS) profile domain-containing protein n=1 Tax=Singulisphaera sp. Ch08 TaxID=3120278 RepID=A0AAU7CG39_9BACT
MLRAKGSSFWNRPFVLGVFGVSSALVGLMAWFGYGTFATRGIAAVILSDPVLAQRMDSYAGAFSLAQLVLGILAVGLGWGARAREESSRLAQGLGASAIGFGALVLLLLLLLV